MQLAASCSFAGQVVWNLFMVWTWPLRASLRVAASLACGAMAMWPLRAAWRVQLAATYLASWVVLIPAAATAALCAHVRKLR